MASDVYVTLIGDLIESRKAKGRADMQRSLERALQSVNDLLKPAQSLESTVGDEFQAAFRDPLSAARASLIVRLTLLKEAGIDTRFGLGWGEVTIFEDRTPVSQDGPGWWSARAAIERVDEISRRARTDFVRTYLESQTPGFSSRGEVDALNAFFFCRDSLVAQMRPRARRLLLGLLLERQQGAVAAEEGISQSAVSQGLANSGAYAIALAEQALMRNLL